MKKIRECFEPGTGEFAAMEIKAADWAAREEFGLSPAERAELDAWLRVDEGHARVYAELNRTVQVLDWWPEMIQKDKEMVSVSGRSSHGCDSGVHGPAQHGAGDSTHSVKLETGAAHTEIHRLRWRLPAGLAAAAGIAIAAFFGWKTLVRDRGPFNLTATTQIGALRRIDLPDGSVILINTDSAVSVHYTGAERRVQLTRGEASFTVAKNRARPFFVEASSVIVRAVGTAFNVRLRTEAVDVVVTQGRVQVRKPERIPLVGASPSGGGSALAGDPASGSPFVTAGEKITIPLGHQSASIPESSTTVTLSPREIEQALAWRDDRLKFEAVPLSEIVAEFNRYNRHQLVITDPDLAKQKFGGTFRPDGYNTLVHLLEQSFDVVADRHGDIITLHRRGD